MMKNPFAGLFRARDKPPPGCSQRRDDFLLRREQRGQVGHAEKRDPGICRVRLCARHRGDHRQPAIRCV